ncbi:Cyclin, N-terminal [Kalmanozyma brasiliensis GHG001]|uniref:Cyclin-like domain-containing protein n=1 Tax=Kalmanozyma brasiliensis (strain GHG001) TaxID=1365824 RepID=V5EZY5_KALBG|nr:Cyclin, N-terminal [Kalmanozyma brasiliensis GHG001]EST08509.1 Cyclin, N-terminal [Kalmanozyma brasiliensis GHG001]
MADIASELAEGVAGPSYSTASMRPITLPSTPHTPPPFGPTSLYAQTSQARNWRFSLPTLSSIRSNANSTARERLTALWAAESSSTPAPPFLTVEEEQSLIAYYLVKISAITHALRLPELVEATATTYVKRFYLRNTVMDFHPKSLVITCIFLASKTENYPLNLGEFARKLAGKQASDKAVVEENRRTVLGLEFLVSQSLGFEYGVRGAHRSLYGLLLDVQDVGVGREEVRELAEGARGKLGTARLTDAEFVYTPSQIALACVRATGERGREVVGLWLDQKTQLARKAALEGKKKRQAVREAEVVRATKVKQALARRSKAKLGAKTQVEETPTPIDPATVEFDDALLEAQPLGMTREELERVLDEIEAMITERETGGYTGQGKGAEDLERIKAIDARQKACMNPENTPGSRLYRKRQAEGEDGEEGNGKRARKDGVDSDDDDVPQADGFSVKPEPKV